MNETERPKIAKVVLEYPADTTLTIEGDEQVVTQVVNALNGLTIRWTVQSKVEDEAK